MRKSKFSETQIVAMLKDAESGVPVADLTRKHGVPRAFRQRMRNICMRRNAFSALRSGASEPTTVKVTRNRF